MASSNDNNKTTDSDNSLHGLSDPVALNAFAILLAQSLCEGKNQTDLAYMIQFFTLVTSAIRTYLLK